MLNFRYAKKHLSCSEDMMNDLKSTMALLAFTPQTTCKKYNVTETHLIIIIILLFNFAVYLCSVYLL